MDTRIYELKAELEQHFEIRKRDKLKDGKERHYKLPRGRFDEHFREAAEICLELNASPVDYIDALFYNKDPDRIHPPFVSSDFVRKLYKEYTENYQFTYDDSLKVQLLYLSQQVLRRNRNVEDALMDDNVSFEPWFRICITEKPIKQVVEKYKSRARAEYNEILKEFLIKHKLDYRRLL